MARAKSKGELLAHLKTRGVEDDIAQAVVFRLQESGLINDREFAAASLRREPDVRSPKAGESGQHSSEYPERGDDGKTGRSEIAQEGDRIGAQIGKQQQHEHRFAEMRFHVGGKLRQREAEKD